MIRCIFAVCACLLCFLLMDVSCLAQIKPVTDEWKQKDSRLSKTVTVWQSRIRMAEFLMILKEQTSVSISVPHDAAFSGMELCVFIKDKPLADVMNALWSFCSVRRHAYYWERSGRSNYRYTLSSTSASKQFPKDLLVALQADYEAHVAFLCQIADKNVEDRRKFRRELIASLHCEKSPEEADYLLDSERFWNKVLLFKQLLTPEQRLSVLRQQEDYKIPWASLSEQAKKLIQNTLHSNPENTSFYDTLSNKSTAVIFTTRFNVQDEDRLVPNLCCGLQVDTSTALDGIESTVSRSNSLRNYLVGQWTLPQDKSISAHKQSNHVVSVNNTEIKTTEKGRSKTSRFRWGRAMERIATAINIPVIAQFIQEFNRPEVEVKERTLRAICEEASKDFERLIIKWNGDFLLVREPIWVLVEDSLLTYSQATKIEAISAAEVKSLTELRDALCNLTEPQWKRVKKEYRALKPADPLRDMLMLTKKLPELLRSGGLVLDASLGEELQRRGYFAGHALMKPENAARVRFVLVDGSTPGRPKVMIRLEAFAEKERDWIMVWMAVIAPPEKYD